MGAVPSPTVATAVETAWGRERGARDQQRQDRASYLGDPRPGPDRDGEGGVEVREGKQR